jgi:thymidylate synthase (FAD)
MNEVKTIWKTPDAEEHICFCARVSSSKQFDRSERENKRLLKYCMRNNHWSIFEMANWTIEIETTRMVSRQFIRHSSIRVQEFSQRYAEVDKPIIAPSMRGKHPYNRQSSIELPTDMQVYADSIVSDAVRKIQESYDQLIECGVAFETARAILPECAPTKLYANSYIRNWIHYMNVRRGNGTQSEHEDLANKIFDEFKIQFPFIASVMEEMNEESKESKNV